MEEWPRKMSEGWRVQVSDKERCRDWITADLAGGRPVLWSAGKLSISDIVVWRDARSFGGGRSRDLEEYWDVRSARIEEGGMGEGRRVHSSRGDLVSVWGLLHLIFFMASIGFIVPGLG